MHDDAPQYLHQASKREQHLRLNGWQRIGFLISVVWLFGGAFWGNEIGLRQGDWASLQLQSCCAGPNANLDACDQEFRKAWSAAISDHWAYAGFVGIVPIPLGWLIVYGIIALVHWIRAGFKSRENPG